jgi:hypothetical protein
MAHTISRLPEAGWLIIAIIAWLAVAEGILTGAVCGVFYGGIVLPIFLMVRRQFLMFRVCEPIASLHAFVAAWLLTCLLFFLRRLFPDGEIVYDITILLGLAVLSLRFLSE